MRKVIAMIISILAIGVNAGIASADNGATVYPNSPSSYTQLDSFYSGKGIVLLHNGCFFDVNHNSLVTAGQLDQLEHLSGGSTLHGVVTPGGQAVIVVRACA